MAIISCIAFFKSPIADLEACPFSDRNLKPRHRVGVFARGLRIGFFPLSKVLHNAAAQVQAIAFIKIGMERVPHGPDNQQMIGEDILPSQASAILEPIIIQYYL